MRLRTILTPLIFMFLMLCFYVLFMYGVIKIKESTYAEPITYESVILDSYTEQDWFTGAVSTHITFSVKGNPKTFNLGSFKVDDNVQSIIGSTAVVELYYKEGTNSLEDIDPMVIKARK